MAHRPNKKQSKHDSAVHAARHIYDDHGKHAWINPGSEKNKSWRGHFIDVIAVEDPTADGAWVIEVETSDSVSAIEAEEQWTEYDSAYTSQWYLAVPRDSKSAASQLLQDHGIENCDIVTWRRNDDGTYTYWELPGL